MRAPVGQRRGVLMNRSMIAARCVVVSLLAVLAPGCRESESGRAAAPLAGQNVLLVTLDTTRADRLGCYRYKAAQTPNLDALSRRGAQFDRAYAQAPITLPSHCSIMTGRHPKELGVRDNGRAALAGRYETLAEIFESHDYRTGAFVAAFVLDSRFGLDQGFEVYDDDLGRVQKDQSLFHWQRPANQVADRALAWLESAKGGPFFAWIHFYDPHEPYAPPEPFAGAHAHPYDGEISFVDSEIGRLTAWLDKNRLSERTLVVVVGDHGESLGEHDFSGHTLFLYENIVRVPMILAHPGAVPVGRRFSDVVEASDLFATTLELMGWSIPGDLRTRSLVPLFSGQSLKPADAYSESNYAFGAFGWSQQRCLIRDRWKYIASTDPSLYDVVADSQETKNLIGERPQIAEQMLVALREFYESVPEGKGGEAGWDAQGSQALASLGYAAGNVETVDEFLTPGLPEPVAMLPVLSQMGEGEALLAQQRFEEAVAVWERIVQAAPRSTQAHAHLGASYVRVGRFAEAEAALRKALEINAHAPVALQSLGDLCAQTGRLDEAIAAYQAANAAPIPNSQVPLKLGDVLVQSGQIEKAVEHYEASLERFPDFAELNVRAGELLLAKGELERAIEHLQKAIDLEPGDARARQQLTAAMDRRASAAASAGEAAAAVAAMERMLEADPANPKVLEELAGHYLGSGKTADAVRILRAGANASADPRTMIVLANLLATSRDDRVRNGQEAVLWAKRVVESQEEPRPADVAVLAAAYAEAGDFAMAIVTAEKAVRAAEDAGDRNLAMIIRGQMYRYQSGQPFRHPQF